MLVDDFETASICDSRSISILLCDVVCRNSIGEFERVGEVFSVLDGGIKIFLHVDILSTDIRFSRLCCSNIGRYSLRHENGLRLCEFYLNSYDTSPYLVLSDLSIRLSSGCYRLERI